MTGILRDHEQAWRAVRAEEIGIALGRKTFTLQLRACAE
jgi:hypothetical protein